MASSWTVGSPRTTRHLARVRHPTTKAARRLTFRPRVSPAMTRVAGRLRRACVSVALLSPAEPIPWRVAQALRRRASVFLHALPRRSRISRLSDEHGSPTASQIAKSTISCPGLTPTSSNSKPLPGSSKSWSFYAKAGRETLETQETTSTSKNAMARFQASQGLGVIVGKFAVSKKWPASRYE